jgi:hypothetical protein
MADTAEEPAVPPETEGPPPWAFAAAATAVADPTRAEPAFEAPAFEAPVFEQPAPTQPVEPAFAAPVAQAAAPAMTDDDLPPPWGTAVTSHAPAAAIDPMAAFAPAVAAPLAPIPDPAFAPAPAQQPPQPVAANVSQATATEQNDLWFLSTEPQESPEAVNSQGAAVASQPTSAKMAAATVAMAIVVIILVLLFIQLMTSILR